MSKDVLSSIQENFSHSLQKIREWFTDFFKKNPENKVLVNNLCNGLPWLAFECQKNKTTTNTKIWLNNLNKNINNISLK